MTQLDHRSLPEALQPMEPEPGIDRQRLAIGLAGIMLGIAFGLLFWLTAEAMRLMGQMEQVTPTEVPIAP